MAGETIGVILGGGTAIVFVWLAVRATVAVFEGEHPPLPSIDVYGDLVNLPEELRPVRKEGGGGVRAKADGSVQAAFAQRHGSRTNS